MQRVERHIVQNNKEIEDLCIKTKNLYNQALYYLRQSVFGKIQYFSEYELSGVFAEFDEENFRALPATTSQQIIKQVFKNYKCWYRARKEYLKNPAKFKGRPKIPNYKKNMFMVIFVKDQTPLKNGFIHFPKMTNLQPLKTKVDNVCQVRIVPQATCFVIEIIYNKTTNKHENLNENNFLSIDLGVNNFATCVNNVGRSPFIINGRPLKSINQMYNKTKAQLMSYVGEGKSSNRIKKLTFYRNNFIEDKIHKISRYIVDYAVDNNIGTIIIGHNTAWKNKTNMGAKNNQNFVSIPHSRFIQKIKYKSELEGIKIIETEESYTSKIDNLALEPLAHQEKYLGKRKKRGLFQSSTNKLINADVNGAIGITRKVIGDSAISRIIDSGLAFNPVKINIF